MMHENQRYESMHCAYLFEGKHVSEKYKFARNCCLNFWILLNSGVSEKKTPEVSLIQKIYLKDHPS